MTEVAYGLPFSVDGMLVVATIVMVDDKCRAHRVRPIARLAFTAGVIASIAANIAAAHPSIGARIIDAWPALALLLVVEMLARPPAAAAGTQTQHRSTEQLAAEVVRTASAAAEEPPRAVTTPADTPAPASSPAEVLGGAQVPAEAAGARIPAGDAAFVHCRQDGAGRTASRDVAAVAGSNRHVRVAGTAHQAVPHSVKTSANTHLGATQRPQTVGGTTVSAGRATSVVRGIGLAAARRNFRRGRHAANFRPEVPAAAPTPVAARAAEPPATEPEPVEGPPVESHAAAPTTAGAAEPTVAGQGAATRRPTAITPAMAHTIMAAEPQLSRTELAYRLGVFTRRLREVLAA